MATYTNLASLFTAIADAIREKTGGTAAIVADNFPVEIAAIQTGGGGSLETCQITIDELNGKTFWYTNKDGQFVSEAIAKTSATITVAKNTLFCFTPGTKYLYSGGVVDISYQLSANAPTFYATADGMVGDM